MTRTYPLPNGNILRFHIGDKDVFGGPEEGFKRAAEGDGWAIDEQIIGYAPKPVGNVLQDIHNLQAKQPPATPPVHSPPWMPPKAATEDKDTPPKPDVAPPPPKKTPKPVPI